MLPKIVTSEIVWKFSPEHFALEIAVLRRSESAYGNLAARICRQILAERIRYFQ
jgi:hypothetical protein